MIADTRTNAGFDDVSTYRKLHVFEAPGDRVVAIATAGNLSITQMALSYLAEGVPNVESGELETLTSATTMFRIAELVGRALTKVKQDVGQALEREHIDASVSLLVGGQIRGGPPRLFMV